MTAYIFAYLNQGDSPFLQFLHTIYDRACSSTVID